MRASLRNDRAATGVLTSRDARDRPIPGAYRRRRRSEETAMRGLPWLMVSAALLALPALAQAPGSPGDARASPGAARPGAAEQRSPGAPLDAGPHTPEANRAHRGGGAVLEGAPGAPAPAPQPTPPLPTPSAPSAPR
jgi:hypothetical protein